jgi:hypothetical protein
MGNDRDKLGMQWKQFGIYSEGWELPLGQAQEAMGNDRDKLGKQGEAIWDSIESPVITIRTSLGKLPGSSLEFNPKAGNYRWDKLKKQ